MPFTTYIEYLLTVRWFLVLVQRERRALQMNLWRCLPEGCGMMLALAWLKHDRANVYAAMVVAKVLDFVRPAQPLWAPRDDDEQDEYDNIVEDQAAQLCSTYPHIPFWYDDTSDSGDDDVSPCTCCHAAE
jgi:hypothetical protein